MFQYSEEGFHRRRYFETAIKIFMYLIHLAATQRHEIVKNENFQNTDEHSGTAIEHPEVTLVTRRAGLRELRETRAGEERTH